MLCSLFPYSVHEASFENGSDRALNAAARLFEDASSQVLLQSLRREERI